MDSITHTVFGACMGEAIAGKKLGKKAMLIGAIANNLPDIDVISNTWAAPAHALLLHRGITHSILVELILTFSLPFLLKRWWKSDMSYKEWAFLIGSGLFTHIFIDAFTAYGTGWFEPFDHYRVSFNTIFIADPLFTITALVCAIALLILRRNSTHRMAWAKTGLYSAVLYLSLITINKLWVNRKINESLSAQSVEHLDYFATPTPLNNILWYIVVKQDKKFSIGYYSIFDKPGPITFEEYPQNDSLLEPLKESVEVQRLMRFSKGYYCVDKKQNGFVFSDMRFGQTGGWYLKNTKFIFNYELEQDKQKKVALQQGRFESFKSEAFTLLWKRIMGEK